MEEFHYISRNFLSLNEVGRIVENKLQLKPLYAWRQKFSIYIQIHL